MPVRTIDQIEDTLFLHNTLTGTVEPFVPLVEGRVGMYCCGPTVYLDQHLGNLRTYLFEDVLRRTLEDCGYEVRHVMNITDVGHLTDDGDEGEDKMIKSARARGLSVEQIAQHYTDQFFRDCRALNITRPTVVCKATDHIPDMIALIERLQERGHTYQAAGNVFYDISTFPGYGRMARLDLDELQAGARIEVDANKRGPHDFGLWFTKSKFERQAMLWDSPWGTGYPGWHIECSAMSMRYLGERFDIHCGGVDHIPVHHTNEIAQSDGATDEPCVRYWVHGEFLVIEGARMAKSGGNIATVSDLVERGFEPLDYRYFCLGAHYRDQHTFSAQGMEAARSARRRLLDRVAEFAERAAGAESPGAEEEAERAWTGLSPPRPRRPAHAALPGRAVGPGEGAVRGSGCQARRAAAHGPHPGDRHGGGRGGRHGARPGAARTGRAALCRPRAAGLRHRGLDSRRACRPRRGAGRSARRGALAVLERKGPAEVVTKGPGCCCLTM